MIGAEELKALGEASYLVNISRGAIIQQEALYNALKQRIIAGAGLDVWYDVKEEDKYGYSSEFPFHELDNVYSQLLNIYLSCKHFKYKGGLKNAYGVFFSNIYTIYIH